MVFTLLFESSPTKDYVDVLADSTLVTGLVASQDAGSSNPGIYYQVGGGGLNYLFKKALGPLCDPINSALVQAYDAHFGDGAWRQDSKSAREDRLTSFYIPISTPRPPGVTVGGNVAGLVYSVGPQISTEKVSDRNQYRQIYVDALSAIASVNKRSTRNGRIEALRMTMLSTGLYGVSDPKLATLLARDVATLILNALIAAAGLSGAADLPTTILINTNVSGSPASKEVDAFTHAATARGITVSASGFTLKSD